MFSAVQVPDVSFFATGRGRIRPTQSHILEGYLIGVLVFFNLNSPRAFLNTYVCRSESQGSPTSSIFVDLFEMIEIQCWNLILPRKEVTLI